MDRMKRTAIEDQHAAIEKFLEGNRAATAAAICLACGISERTFKRRSAELIALERLAHCRHGKYEVWYRGRMTKTVGGSKPAPFSAPLDFRVMPILVQRWFGYAPAA